MPDIDFNAIYWLENVESGLPPEIVGDVEYFDEKHELHFWDTQRGKAVKAKFIKKLPDFGFEFEGNNGQKIFLGFLDYKTFDKVFRKIAQGAPEFSSDIELQDYYRKLIRDEN